jgi:arylsulfatase A-like enzyme
VEIVDRGVEALDRGGSRPLFLFLNFIDTHHPYRPPRSFTGVYPGVHRPGLVPLPDEQKAAWQAMAGRHALSPQDRAAWEAEYDSGMAYLDRELGRLLDRLRRDPRFPGMLVLITSDHGEGFGEHGIFRHSTGLYDELLHVPLFIKPGARRPASFVSGGTVAGPFQSVDVFPTVLAHAGLPVPKGLDGLAWGAGRTVSYSESYVHPPAAAAFGGRFRAEVRGVETNGWRLLAWSTGDRELYDLRADPGERRDLAPAHPEEVARLESLLRSGPAPFGGGRRPSRRAPWDERLERDLRSLGYVQ